MVSYYTLHEESYMKNKLLFTLFLPFCLLTSCGNGNANAKLVNFKSNVPKTYQFQIEYVFPDENIKVDIIRTYVTANDKNLYVEYSHRIKTNTGDNSNEDTEMLAIWSENNNRFYVYDWKGSSYHSNQYAYSTAESYLTWCDDIEFKENNVKKTNEYFECKGHGDYASETYRISNDEYKVCIYHDNKESNSRWTIKDFSATVTMEVGHETAIADINFEG